MTAGLAAVLAVRLAAEILLAGGLTGWMREVPERFGRFLLTAAGTALGLALVLGRARPEFWWWAALFVLVAGLRLAAGRLAAVPPKRLAAASALLGLLGAALPGLLAPAVAGAGWVPVLAHFAGAGLFGATASAMVLGHWYLVDTALSIRPLAFACALFGGAALLRLGVTAASLLVGGSAELRVGALEDLIYSTPALFFCFRAITGLLAPLVLAWLVRSTVRIRSTQSATGLLYVALILVLFGELTAVFLETLTGGRLA